jgi:hypothetical protein
MVFLYFSNKLNCKLEKNPLCCSKNYENLEAGRIEDKEQRFLGIMFKFKTEFELKILEAKLILNVI